MTEIKTKPTNLSVDAFLNTIEPEGKRRDAFRLLELMSEITGKKAVMWGTAIVGFGLYHYKSEKSRQEGDWPLIAFSPRKQSLTLYLMRDAKDSRELLKKLGKHTTSVACLYIKRLSDVDESVLIQLMKNSWRDALAEYAKDIR